MPVEALPEPWGPPKDAPVRVRFQRVYVDLLDRPLTGAVRLAAKERAVEGHRVVPPAAVEVKLVDGVIDLQLPPGDYTLLAQLVTVDGTNVVDRHEFTLTTD